MRKPYYFCVLVLAVAAIFSVSSLTPASDGADDRRSVFSPSVVPVPVSLPVMNALPGSAITVPVTVGNTTGLGIISYDFQVSFDPAVVTPALPPIDRTGTLSSAMLVTPNAGFPGHLIITGFQATPLTGSGTLLFLKFNVTGSSGQSTALTFENYTDPGSGIHPACVFNEGDPPVTTTNGSFTISTPTPTATNTNTPTDTPTNTATNTATNTPTDTPTNTATNTATSTPTFLPTPSLGNYPAASIPLSTNTTITPDAAPLLTTSMNVSASTNFKGKLAADPATGIVRITDAHPAGTYPVTVTAFGTGGLTNTRLFTLTVTTPAVCNPVSFAPATNYAVGTAPQSVAVGDFNVDGKQDLVTANYNYGNPGTLSILMGTGAGDFDSSTNLPIGIDPISVVVGDFNGDGKHDLAITDAAATGSVSILLGDGSGNFGTATIFAVENRPVSIVIGDFNGDGKQDIATANYNSGNSSNVSIILGNGIGGFSPATNFGPVSDPRSLALGDFNRDGKQDLAVANYLSDNISILLGDGLGNFDPVVNFSTAGGGSGPWSIAAGDFNSDGNQDLAVALTPAPKLAIFLGDGIGSFGSRQIFDTGAGPITVAIADFNGDGNQDVVTTNSNPNSNVSILMGNGSGSFGAANIFGAGGGPYFVAVGDFNGDGKQDIAIANENSHNVSILLRDCTISGTVTYGNAIGAPTPRFVSNVLLNAAGPPDVSTTTDFPGGSYSLGVFGPGPYTVTPSKTGGTNNAINSFDAGRIAAHVSGSNILTGSQLVAADVSGNGLVQSFDAGLIARYVTGTPGWGSSGTWKFLPVSRTYATINSNLAGEDYTAFLLGDVSGNWTNTGARPVGGRQLAVGSGPVRNVTVEAPSAVSEANKQILIPVTVNGAADKGIIAYEFDLRYDPSVIQPDSDPVELSGTISRALTAVVNASEPGLLRVAVYGAMPIGGNGILLNLRFTAVGASGSVSPLTWERIMFNDGDPRTSAVNGWIEIAGK